MKIFFVTMLLTSALLGLPAKTLATNNEGYESEVSDPLERNSIVVTGTVLQSNQVNSIKTPTPIINVPQSLSITTNEQILDRGYTTLSQIIDYVPGLNSSQGEGHRDAIVFRGVRSTADFFLDGARDDVQYYRGLYNIEQVEILRGPNALLFGRGGSGGILNRVTKKGELNTTYGTGQIAIDTFGGVGVQGDLNLSTSDSFGVRLNGMYESLNNHRDFFGGDRIGLNPTARIQLGDNTLVDLSYEYANHDRFVDRGIPTGRDGRPVDELNEIVFGDPELNFADLKAHLLRGNIQHQFTDNLKGVLNTFYGDYEKVYSNFYVSGYDQINTPGLVTTDGYIDTNNRQNLMISANLIGEFETGLVEHTILFGAEYIDTSSDQDRFNVVWDQTNDDNELFNIMRPLNLTGGIGINSAGNTTRANFTTDLNDFTQAQVNVLSLYIQDEIKLTNWLHAVVGGRFDSFDIEVLNVPADELRSRKDNELSPRGGLIIKPASDLSLYASYSESFLPRSGEQFANINGSNNALDPDNFKNIEAGVKWDFADGMSVTSAIFEIKQSSPQPNDGDPSTLDVVNSKVQGFEVQLEGEVIPGWVLAASYSYLDGEQVGRQGASGLRPRELPKSTFSIWNRVQVTGRLGLGLGVTYQDESFVNSTNSAILPGYARVDAAAYFHVSDKVRLQVNLENLTDNTYYPHSHSTHQVSVGAPINARFAVTGRF